MITPYWLLDIFLLAGLIYLLVVATFFVLQSKLIFIPTIEMEEYKYRLASASREFSVNTNNNGKINSLLITVPDSKGLIFYLHGNAGSIKRWKFMAEELSTQGFDVCIPDYRGYGKSRGKRVEEWLHLDMEEVFDHIAPEYEGKKLIIYGRSLGSGFATRLASARKVDAVILETPFYSLEDVANSYFPFLPVTWLLRFRFRSDKYIRHISAPCLILHGTKDRVVPYNSALKLYNSVSGLGHFNMVTINGGRHNNLNAYPLFREKLSDFLDEI